MLCKKGEVCNFIKKEALALLFTCEFREISKNIFFREHLVSFCVSSVKDSRILYDYMDANLFLIFKLLYFKLALII